MNTNRTSHDAPIIVISVLLSIIVVVLWMLYLGAIRIPAGASHVERSTSYSQPA
jgi:ABC-type Na+ efflux pump permease subunit